MESFFNVAWAVLGVVGIAAGMVFRRHLMPWKKRELVRDVVLLGVIAFILLPVVSMSDDIGYFSYYFSGGQTQDGLFWVSGSRREKQLSWVPVLQVVGVLLAAALGAFYQSTLLGIVPVAESPRGVDRSTATAYLRAPPSSLI